MARQNTIDRAVAGMGSTIVRAGEMLRKARKDFGHAHEPRQRALTALVACLVALVLTSLAMTPWGETSAVDAVELRLRDTRVRNFENPDVRDPDILLIVVDENALAYGDDAFEADAADRFAWPWPRHVYNKLLRYCREGGARVVQMDFAFSESGPNTNEFRRDVPTADGVETIFTLDRASDDLFILEATARPDVVLSLALTTQPRKPELRDSLLPAYHTALQGPQADVVLEALKARYGPYQTPMSPIAGLLDGWPAFAEHGRTDPEAGVADIEGFAGMAAEDPSFVQRARYRSLLPLPTPSKPRGVAGVGLVQSFADTDGLMRRADLAGVVSNKPFPSVALEMWRLYVFSYARDVQQGSMTAQAFADRFHGLSVRDGKVHDAHGAYAIEGELRDAALHFSDGTCEYLGRTIPVDAQGQMLLRWRTFLPASAMPAVARGAVKSADPGRITGAFYPEVSAADILRDWDLSRENKHAAARRDTLREQITGLEQRLRDAPDDKQIKAELDAARAELAKWQRDDYPLVFGEPASLVKDKVVMIAGTALALYDYHPTPMSATTQGTHIIATEFDNLKNNDHMTESPRWLAWLMALGGTLLTVLTVMLAGRLRNGLLLTVLLALLVLVLGWVAFTQQHFFHVTAPLAGLFIGFGNGSIAKALTEGRQRRQREAFARQYMGRELLDYVIKNPGSLKLGGENREMTVFFSDVAGFTTVTETLGANNPERLVELLNIYLERMTDLMLATGGVVDKYIGDAIMVFWGAPQDMADHAVRACQGALACRTELQRMQGIFADAVRGIAPQLIKPDGSVLLARAGINSGLMTVGNMGSSKRFAYTVMGDAVNLGARLEPQCKEYGTEILIGQNTEKLIRGQFTTRPIDLIVVKGKTEPVEVFELVGDLTVPGFVQEMLGDFNQGVQLFRDRQFENALEHFRRAEKHEMVQDQDEINPSRLYTQRCEDYLEVPPPADWNGVFIKKTK